MRTSRLLLCLAAAIASSGSIGAFAEAPAAPALSADTTAPPGAFAEPVDSDALGALRGGRDIAYNDMTLDGTTAGNTADHIVTGANTFGTGAFTGMSGIPLVVQKSGANVLIQNAVIVNIKME